MLLCLTRRRRKSDEAKPPMQRHIGDPVPIKRGTIQAIRYMTWRYNECIPYAMLNHAVCLE